VHRRQGSRRDVVEETDFSVIYQADHFVWQRPVAIQTIKAAHLDADARSNLLASFIREGALLAELSELSTAICQARDIGSVTMPDGTWIPFMVPEWLEGKRSRRFAPVNRRPRYCRDRSRKP
jgi:hypothetical protein